MSHTLMPGSLNQVEDSTMVIFDRDGVWAGLNALANERYQKALRSLKSVDPTDAIGVSLLQAQAAFWEKTVPSIYDQFQNYVARKATQPPVNPAPK